MGNIVVRAAEPSDGEAMSRFFHAAGSSCFCRWWSFDGDKNDWLARTALSPETSEAEMRAALAADAPDGRGLVAVEEAAIVGWLKLSPAAAAPRIFAQRYYRALSCFDGDRSGVLVIGCLLVLPSARRSGVAGRLVEGAVAEARRQGGRFLEALPRVTAERVTDEELWLGPASVFARLGFVAVGGDPAYPVVRLDLGTNGGTP